MSKTSPLMNEDIKQQMLKMLISSWKLTMWVCLEVDRKIILGCSQNAALPSKLYL